jgi:hypothetical protein
MVLSHKVDAMRNLILCHEITLSKTKVSLSQKIIFVSKMDLFFVSFLRRWQIVDYDVLPALVKTTDGRISNQGLFGMVLAAAKQRYEKIHQFVCFVSNFTNIISIGLFISNKLDCTLRIMTY